MTRDEAVAKATPVMVRSQGMMTFESSEANKLVDALVALGILKLDEPNANDIFHERMEKYYGLTNRESFLRKLNVAGLRIVEK